MPGVAMTFYLALAHALSCCAKCRLNLTELSMKVSELESKHHSSELRAMEEKERAERLARETQEAELELQRQKLRAEAAEKERDLHQEVAKRHEERGKAGCKSKWGEVVVRTA